MNKIFYIDEDYVKENSELQEDVLIKKLTRSIWLVQKTYIQNILGSALYTKINNDIIAGTLAGDYLELFEEYIQPTTLEYALFKSAPFIAYALTNKSIVKKDSDNNVTATLEEIQFIQTQYQKSGEFLGDRCVKYLLQGYLNEEKFPEYGCEYNEDLNEIKANKADSANYSGMYLNFGGKNRYNISRD